MSTSTAGPAVAPALSILGGPKLPASHRVAVVDMQPRTNCRRVTHEMGFAKTVANRVIIMDGGQIIE